ncbi:hypothetical protein ACH5RR_001206 [Cinchona calisaya]|uniref:MADS-box domain-containing protein n=1 Tax=Cinchona calisaya TaxID=153742 RepID=A0ABD3B2S4_9GENT
MVHEKKTRGRQKIDIVKIENEQNLQVTFCKRHSGLFKKASELCTLTGSEVALVVAYCFGSPSVNAIIDRFESQTPKSIDSSNLLLEAHRKINVQHLNNELTILQNHFETEKKRGKTLNQQRKVGETRHRWEAPIKELNLEQLEQFNLALLELQKNVKSELRKIIFEHSNQIGNLGQLNPYGIDLFGINAREISPSVFY